MNITSHYDVILRRIDANEMTFEQSGNSLVLPTFPNISHLLNQQIGLIGLVRFDPDYQCWRFTPYLDQSLRRVYAEDSDGYLGWRCDAKPNPWLASAHIIPGKNGQFMEDETTAISIDIPPEFFALCARLKQTPEGVLRGFIADACELINFNDCPREDGYDSHGSDERRLADEYLDRVYGGDEE